MTWQDAILRNATIEVQRLEVALWEAARPNRFKDPATQWIDHLEENLFYARENLLRLELKVEGSSGPLEVFGGHDTWLDCWDGQSNWIEALILNSSPKHCVDLLTHLGIIPTRTVTERSDDGQEIVRKKPMELLDYDEDSGKFIPMTSEEFLFLIKARFRKEVKSLGGVQ